MYLFMLFFIKGKISSSKVVWLYHQGDNLLSNDPSFNSDATAFWQKPRKRIDLDAWNEYVDLLMLNIMIYFALIPLDASEMFSRVLWKTDQIWPQSSRLGLIYWILTLCPLIPSGINRSWEMSHQLQEYLKKTSCSKLLLTLLGIIYWHQLDLSGPFPRVRHHLDAYHTPKNCTGKGLTKLPYCYTFFLG